MSHHQLGQIDESRIVLDRLRCFMQDASLAPPSHYGVSDWPRAVTSPTFLGEAEALIGDGTAPDDDQD